MSGGSKNGLFKFDEYRLDSGKLMLYRGGVEVSIPPKVAKTLVALVENAGTIISKEDLIERVWDDSIVEESNLTQYLYVLRKVLGTTPDGRPYIETLRRRGYRFNGDVEFASPVVTSAHIAHSDPAPQISGIERDGNVLRVVDWPGQETAPETEPRVDQAAPGAAIMPAPPNRRFAIISLVIVVLAVVAVGAAFVWLRPVPVSTNAEARNELSFVRVTNGFYPAGAAISPDGNVFVYHELDGETARMFVQQTGQSPRTEIASTTTQAYGSKTLSPDGQMIFFTATDKRSSLPSLYRIPTMGGAPVKILDDVFGGMSFSPDGKEFVFTRRAQNGDMSLVIASADGRTERVVAQRKSPKLIHPAPSWSPDGKLVAFGDFDFFDGPKRATSRVNLLNVATGQTSFLSSENWESIFRTVWAPDGKGVFLIGTRRGEEYSANWDQVHFISYPEGVSRRVTTEGYRHEPDSLSISRKGDLLAVPMNRASQIWSVNADGNANSAVQLTKGAADGRAGIGPMPDGKFAYLTRNADEIPMMMAGPDGSNSKPVATGFQFIEELRADPKGRFFIFSSLKDEKNRLFRIDPDGSNLKQLTFGEGRSIDTSISPDGKHIAFDSVIDGNDPQTYSLMRMSSDGSDQVVLAKGCYIPTYSPDGSLISCISVQKPFELIVVSAADGAILERHPLPRNVVWNFGIGFTSDGAGLLYIVNEKGVSNLMIQPRDGSKSRMLTNFANGAIYRYVYSPDGTKIYLARGYPSQDAIVIKGFR